MNRRAVRCRPARVGRREKRIHKLLISRATESVVRYRTMSGAVLGQIVAPINQADRLCSQCLFTVNGSRSVYQLITGDGHLLLVSAVSMLYKVFTTNTVCQTVEISLGVSNAAQ